MTKGWSGFQAGPTIDGTQNPDHLFLLNPQNMRPMTLVKDRSFQNSLEISYPLSLSLSFIFVFWFKNISLERSFCENDPFLSLPLQNKYWHREPPLHHFCLSIIIRVLLFLRTWEFLHRTISSFRGKNHSSLHLNSSLSFLN